MQSSSRKDNSSTTTTTFEIQMDVHIPKSVDHYLMYAVITSSQIQQQLMPTAKWIRAQIPEEVEGQQHNSSSSIIKVNDELCVICQDLVQLESKGKAASNPTHPMKTPCGHWFHESCLRKYLRGVHGLTPSSSSCPLCRSPLSLNDGEDTGRDGVLFSWSTLTPVDSCFVPLSIATDSNGAPLQENVSYLVVLLLVADCTLPIESFCVMRAFSNI
jgi:hypothetical protein